MVADGIIELNTIIKGKPNRTRKVSVNIVHMNYGKIAHCVPSSDPKHRLVSSTRGIDSLNFTTGAIYYSIGKINSRARPMKKTA